jgi:hypothetical protein
LSKYSKSKLMDSFARQDVPKEWAEILANYLAYGFHPGSFFAAFLSNDAMGMIGASHTNNTVPAMKTVMKWLSMQTYPGTYHGSPAAVKKWLAMTPTQRRKHLEKTNLIYTEKQEIVMILKDEPVLEPDFRS